MSDIDVAINTKAKELTELIIESVIEQTKLQKEDFIEIFKGVEVLIDQKIEVAIKEIEANIDQKLSDSFAKLAETISVFHVRK